MSIFTNPNKNRFEYNSLGGLNPIVPSSTSKIFI